MPEFVTITEWRDYAALLEEDLDNHKHKIQVLKECLHDVIAQACYHKDALLDSCGIIAYADAMRLLANYGMIEIISDEGHRVIAKLKG